MVADAGDYASSWWWYHGQTAARTFEFGDFANDLPMSCSNCTASQDALNLLPGVAAEAARSTLRQALITWS